MEKVNELVLTSIGYNEDAPQIVRSYFKVEGSVTSKPLIELLSSHLITLERVMNNPKNDIETELIINNEEQFHLSRVFGTVVESLNSINMEGL